MIKKASLPGLFWKINFITRRKNHTKEDNKDEVQASNESMAELPLPILMDILCRLPVKTILQCKCVCRTWFNLLSDPYFAQICLATAPLLVLLLTNLEQRSICNDDFLVPLLRLNRIGNVSADRLSLLTSCNGLLCLRDLGYKKDEISVCNPILRDHMTLPQLRSKRVNRRILGFGITQSTNQYKPCYGLGNPFTRDYIELPKSTELLHQNPVFGFGFNQTTSQNKVVKAVYQKLPFRRCGLHHSRILSFQAEVQILTLGSPAWRNFGRLPYCLVHQGPSQVLICGRIHWRSWPRKFHSGCFIISFDLEDEQFREVPKPDCDGLDRTNFHLVDLGGCLSAAIFDTYGQFEIWIMKEYNVKESWIKEFNIGNHVPRSLEEMDWNSAAQPFRGSKLYRKNSFVRILCLLKNGDILLSYKGRALVTYDQKDGTFKDLTFPGLPSWFEAVVHEGSLQWID